CAAAVGSGCLRVRRAQCVGRSRSNETCSTVFKSHRICGTNPGGSMSAVVDVNTRVSAGRAVQRNPLPVPFGWFFVAYSHELKPGELRNVQYFGQEWVQFRTEQGEMGMVDPYCPHLGAHIGHGGKVDGESIRCPFHQ